MKIKATRMVITATIKLKKINLLTKPKPCAVSKYVRPLDPLKAATLYPMVLPQAVITVSYTHLTLPTTPYV